MKTKAGVVSFAPHPSILHAMELVDLYWRKKFGDHATVTSIRDSAHAFTSFHYGTPTDFREQGFDVRTRDLAPGDAKLARLALKALLGEAFDVVLEADHLHIERDVKWLL